MDFINEAFRTSRNELKNEVSVKNLDEIYNEFAIHLSYDEDDSHADLLVQFGVGGPA